MIPVTDEEQVKQIVELVKKYLAPHQPKGYQLKVISSGIQQEDDWYYVLVEPDKENVYFYDYNARLVEAEMELQEKEQKKILLVPAMPN